MDRNRLNEATNLFTFRQMSNPTFEQDRPEAACPFP